MPRSIETALAHGSMENLASDRSDLVGLWLVQASLGRLWDNNDNLATTHFLDRNRAWLSAQESENPRAAASQALLLKVGLELFATFAADLDPASAEAALGRANRIRPAGKDPVRAPGMFTERAAQIVVAVAQAPLECCTIAGLSAAALVLCGADQGERSPLDTARERACGRAASWFEETVVQAAGH